MTTLSKFNRVGLLPLRLTDSTSSLLVSKKSKVVIQRNYQVLAARYVPLNRRIPFHNTSLYQTRNVGMLVGRLLRGALKIRYLLLGGAVGGGISLQRVSLQIVFDTCIQIFLIIFIFTNLSHMSNGGMPYLTLNGWRICFLRQKKWILFEAL